MDYLLHHQNKIRNQGNIISGNNLMTWQDENLHPNTSPLFSSAIKRKNSDIGRRLLERAEDNTANFLNTPHVQDVDGNENRHIHHSLQKTPISQ